MIGGLDLSLTGTGIAVHHDGGEIETDLIKSTGTKNMTIDQTAYRLAYIKGHALAMLMDCELVVVEAPSYGSTGGAAHERAGLWWMVVNGLVEMGVKVARVAPTTMKAYVTNNGQADKDEVIAAVVRKYPQAKVKNNNVADAVGLLAMGLRYKGMPIDPVNSKTEKSMKAVVWP